MALVRFPPATHPGYFNIFFYREASIVQTLTNGARPGASAAVLQLSPPALGLRTASSSRSLGRKGTKIAAPKPFLLDL